MTFLDENYKQPETVSKYLKFKKDWDTEFRILSDAITGYVYFNTDNKPERSKEYPTDWEANSKINEKNWKKDTPKHFWAFSVWNYETKQVCILEITQKSIQNDIMAYYKNAKRGDPKDYDITVTRKGEWLDTKYTVISNPKTEVDKDVLWAYFDAQINLAALYEWADPFKK